MCLASKNGGYLPPIDQIAWKLRKKDSEISSLVAALYERGLLDQDGGTFSPHNWDSRQYCSDVSTERVRRFRETKKQSETVSCVSPPFQKRDETVPETVPDTETEQNRADTETENAPVGALSVVRSKGKRSTEEIRKALGERLPWWEEFWRTFPCHESMNPAMDAFERTIQTVDVFQAVMDGARRYAAKARADPTMRLKYGQGWINDQRWTDENSVQLQTRSGQLNFVDQVSRQIEERLARGETPW